MCRLFAVTGKGPIRVNNVVRDFYKGSYIHRHGWGYADFTGGKDIIKKEAEPAYDSEYLDSLLATPFYVQNAIFHIRYATVGEVEPENAHPLSATDLTGKSWHVIHNGTIFDFDGLNEFFYRQSGSTDTERLLLYIVDRIDRKIAERKGALSAADRFDVVERALKAMADGNKLNIILYDGELLYVHANSRNGSRMLGDAGKNDFLYESEEGGTRYFSTAPLDRRNWIPVRLNTVMAYRDGEKVFEGSSHEDEYFETDEDIRQMYRGFSAL
ncbi:MAG: class II glutamine amidotransferase [Clostridiales Family XIII bacterium]|jgi:glutamine amidotransferase|nr:class II glutamine amidotransferase [Clostridiales Family XIII bacterium]